MVERWLYCSKYHILAELISRMRKEGLGVLRLEERSGTPTRDCGHGHLARAVSLLVFLCSFPDRGPRLVRRSASDIHQEL